MSDRRLRSLALETVAFVRSACALARAKHLDARRRAPRTSHRARRTSHFAVTNASRSPFV
jgi:hypothetical protein